MLKIFRNLQLISKDEFDYSLYQCTSSEDMLVPKHKYMKPIIECLKGQDQKILPLDAFNKFYDLLCQVSYCKWVTALKLGYVLHFCIEQDCHIFIEAVCCNHLYDKIRNNSRNKTDDPIAKLHVSIVQHLYSYLQIRYENYLFFQNALGYFDEKEEFQKTIITQKMVASIQALVKITKDLDISLQKFPNIEVMKHVCIQLLTDLYFFYPKVQVYLTSRIHHILDMPIESGLKLYQVYTDTLRLGRSVTHMLKFCNEVSSIQQFPQLTLFSVDQNFNRQIELHFKEIKRPPSPVKMDIVKFDDDSLLEQLKEEQVGTPPKLLQKFQKMVTQTSEPQPDEIEYRVTCKPKTERLQQTFKIKKKEFNEQSLMQSVISTSDNCSTVRQAPFSHQSSFRNEFLSQSQSPLNFLDFPRRKQQ